MYVGHHHPPDREGTGRYVVVRPDEQHREFDHSTLAVQALLEREGYGELFGPNGKCVITKGAPPAHRIGLAR
jgi:hypothetical protein